ncbi:DNA primase [Methanohalophilus levihalophilus]|uniref:DNA primase DnaG n=1 Tax=Methanohalophilus levihalophilus TaxID=1431282 RepID=UPI001AE73EA1|nr:DNA primase DnaG [Methanohalophilus levihalophilus]MBP2029937.1 DNA primase [Methanohalophilus levihalophilus]
MQSSDTTKYIIHSKVNADGVIERPDIVGAIFGQTEGLLGSDLDLRDLQKTGRIGRIEVIVNTKGGKTRGNIHIPSSLDRIETSILAASLETIDRVGPCTAKIEVSQIEDVRATKRKHIIDRAKYILTDMFDENLPESQEIAEEVRQSVRIEEMQYYGKNKIPCGPNVLDSDAIVVVEGRADVLNLLRYGIKNTICVGGTNVPPEVAELTKKKTVTAFTDGDRGGKLIIKELLQVADIDYVARAPDGKSVEDLVQREIVRSLRQKVPVEQAIDAYSIEGESSGKTPATAKKGRLPRVAKRKERVVKPDVSRTASKTKDLAEPKERKESRHRPERRQSPARRSYPPEASRFKKHSEDLTGTLGARLLDNEDKVISETPVRDLVNALKESEENIKSVVFDGVITQRILDIASSRGIENLVGVKRGNITKNPTSVKVYTAQGA